ncbi:MAG TPA: iron-sulfur cluster assembly accessory protein [Armatimonadota bacterium]|jgi:iron-sulfur cluster assembly protein
METLTIAAQDDAPVVVTESAKRQFLRLLERQGKAGAGLRLGVRGGGCSGLSYFMEPETSPGERDRTYDLDGLTLVMDLKSLVFLRGMVVDYSTSNLMGGGFTFDNPNAAKSCGCGTSFTPKDA